mmetsp:Transcript_13785/g.27740  ORF Transcript_13785/g.27740 Transcript_13785/m.27740 type:complete len:110 (-) Transcript_13785:3097-3426(-)
MLQSFCDLYVSHSCHRPPDLDQPIAQSFAGVDQQQLYPSNLTAKQCRRSVACMCYLLGIPRLLPLLVICLVRLLAKDDIDDFVKLALACLRFGLRADARDARADEGDEA